MQVGAKNVAPLAITANATATNALPDFEYLSQATEEVADGYLRKWYTNATEGDIDRFVEAYRKDLEPRAKKGDPKAQYRLSKPGYCETTEAVTWLRKAAEQGYVPAQNTLGFKYDFGSEVPKDAAQAAYWYRKAAEQGDADAQSSLGSLYEFGTGVAKDYAEAVKWYRKAAEQGNAEAQVSLAECYMDGRGIAKSDKDAEEWFLKAIQQENFLGREIARRELGMFYGQLGDLEVPKNYAEAAKWYRKGAELGNAWAQYKLGVMYHAGRGVPEDFVEARRWSLKAVDQYCNSAERGDADAQLKLAVCYENMHDDSEAVKWYRRAAEQGCATAQGSLGMCYDEGNGTPQNDIEAYKWYCLAAAQGFDSAKLRDLISQRMARAEVVEGQRRAAVFVAKKEGGGGGAGSIPPTPEIAEGKGCVGTGFFVTEDGYFVTCEHVVRGASSFHVTSPSGPLPARLIKKNRTIDVAVLKVDGAFRALPVAAQPRVKLGEAVFTVGFPNPVVQGVEPKLTRGEISSMAGARDNPRYYQISVPVQPGNSGGALLDECGNAVGVVTSRLDDAATYEESGALPQNVNYAVKSSVVYAFLGRVPELSGKLKAVRIGKDREAASGAAERAAVLVVAE
jgi:TPR repeat protein